MNRPCLPLLGILFCVLLPLNATAKIIVVSDVRDIVGVSDPQISPDGKQIAVLVTRSDYDANIDKTDLVVVNVADGAQKTLTHKVPDVSSPRWSPSGDGIAFIATSGSGERAANQIFMISKQGGKPKRITSATNGVEGFAWRPDGSAIAYSTADDPPNKKAIEKGHDEFEVGDDPYLETAAPMPSHLWLIAVAGGKAQRVTSGSWSLPSLDVATPLTWSPDGKYIAVTKWPNAHPGDSNPSTIALVEMATHKIRRLTQHSGFEGFAQFSPDGAKIAYWYPKNGDALNGTKIFVASVSGGENGTDITAGLDRDVSRHLWMPDNASLLIGASDGTRVALWIQPLNGRARRIELGNVNPNWDNWVDVNVGKDASMAFAGSESKRPTELYYMSSPEGPVRRLTDFNHRIAALELGKTERVTWHGPDNFHEDGTLTYPPHYQLGKKYPLLVDIHGGPNYTSTEEFWDLPQLVAAHGYLFFRPNYRGSDNLGDAFEHAIFNDAGDGPGRDIMAGLKAVEDMGIVDTSRIAVAGHSYGGFMTAWLVSHYQGWKADVLYAAELDPLAEYNLEDFNVAEWYYFKTSPWVSSATMEEYRKQAPITYADRIKTPTLIISNTGDVRVPITQSFALFHALRDNHVPVKFIAFPGPGHDISGPVHIEDMYRIWLGWLDHYLK